MCTGGRFGSGTEKMMPAFFLPMIDTKHISGQALTYLSGYFPWPTNWPMHIESHSFGRCQCRLHQEIMQFCDDVGERQIIHRQCVLAQKGFPLRLFCRIVGECLCQG